MIVFFSTTCGVVCSDGIILGTEKIVINKMMLSGTDKRVYTVTKEIGSVSSLRITSHKVQEDLLNIIDLTSFMQVVNGLTPDGRALMFRAREEAKQYFDNYGIKIPG